MPRGDGTGPTGKGSGTGRGLARGGGRGIGPGGNCVCPKCGKTLTHQRGVPCFDLKCPNCGTAMVRE